MQHLGCDLSSCCGSAQLRYRSHGWEDQLGVGRQVVRVHQPTFPQTQSALAGLEWISRAENLAITGPSGTGKTHFVEALAHNVIDLARSIAARGALISEMPPGTSPTRYTFQARNRIIAALARGTVIGEAAARSGALNTTTWTTAIGRPLMAIPGDATHPLSAAPNALIRDHTAQLVTTAHDITQALPIAGRDRAMQLRADVEAARADVDTATATLTRAWQRVADTRRRLDQHLNQQ